MDNASFHKRTDIQEAIHGAGHTLEYLPPYSPDFNPIEHTWANIKEEIRTTYQSLEYIIKQNFESKQNA